jgi:zinc transporter, ZIP family
LTDGFGLDGWGSLTLAVVATSLNWVLTAAGSASVFAIRRASEHVLRTLLGFAAGVMLAASYWSLLAPSIELSEDLGMLPWFPPLIGFLSGGVMLLYADRVLHQLRPRQAVDAARGTPNRSILVASAIAIHNLPEGLAVGVAFGALSAEGSGASLASAIGLSVGIGIQNIPEGMAISLPLRADGMSRMRAFVYGQASGAVEVVGGVVGALGVLLMTSLLPFALAFSAGAMILVALKELIPESMATERYHSAMGLVVGFSIMMVLDVALG